MIAPDWRDEPVAQPNNAKMPDSTNLQAMFCLALIPEGTDVTRRVLTRFIKYRDNPNEFLKLIE